MSFRRRCAKGGGGSGGVPSEMLGVELREVMGVGSTKGGDCSGGVKAVKI